ncbi:sigma 54-interacting transcriptional regulator [bacterium]|nr:sigma 54-interacting transcriptional regulator [bacterium]
MRSIAYWDMDSQRIKKVICQLQGAFEVTMAASLAELARMGADGLKPYAVIMGSPPVEKVRLQALLRTLSSHFSCPIVLLAGEEDAELTSSPPGVLVQRGDLAVLQSAIAGEAERLAAEARRRASLFIGRSNSIRRVVALVSKYAESRHSVLILGETGTGKEIVARALHEYSSRRANPFVALNCSALPDGLAESELFGAERGAFTDAVQRRGALCRASKGTLFLDEIGSMSLAVQPKLLRALETGEFLRLGAEKSETSDFRLVSATCEEIERWVAEGRFRSDLFFRISDLPIRLPSLRERLEDVPDLAEHFCREAGRGACSLSRGAFEKLADYDWPGNVRELKSVLNRACANVQEGTIGADDIMFMFRGAKAATPRPRL